MLVPLDALSSETFPYACSWGIHLVGMEKSCHVFRLLVGHFRANPVTREKPDANKETEGHQPESSGSLNSGGRFRNPTAGLGQPDQLTLGRGGPGRHHGDDPVLMLGRGGHGRGRDQMLTLGRGP